MRKKLPILLSLTGLLWLIGISSPSIASAPKKLADGRLLLSMPDKDRALLMERMRGALAIVQGILIHSEKGNWGEVAKLAGHLSNKGVKADMKNFSAPPPIQFIKMAKPFHDLFDQIERDALTKKNASHTRGQLSQALGQCVACHAAFALYP